MDEFTKPTIEYSYLAPLLIVFAVACLGVLVEAFVPRKHRFLVQATLAIGGVLVTLGATIAVAYKMKEHGEGADTARGIVGSMGTIVVDGPSVFLWGLILVFALGGCLLFAEREIEGGVSAFAGQAAALPGTEAERKAAGLDHTEVYPLLLFAVLGMMLFPASGDLITMFVALEVLSLPLYLLCGLARRRRLLSQEAALKYFVLGAFSSGFFLYGVALTYGFAGSMNLGDINEAVRNDSSNQTLMLIGLGMLAVGLLFKVGAAPFQAWTPDVYQGAPTAVTAFMSAATKTAAFGAIMRLFYVAFGADRWSWQPMMWVVAILSMLVGAVLAVTQRDVKRMLAYSAIAHTGFILTGVLGLQSADELSAGPADLAPGGALLPGDVRRLGARRVRRGLAGARRGRRAERPRALGRHRQALSAGGGSVRAVHARPGRHPAHVGLHRQVGRLRGCHVLGCVAGRHRRRDQQHDHGVHLRLRHRRDVLPRPGAGHRGVRRAPLDPDLGHHRGGCGGDDRARHHPRPGAQPGRGCGTIRQVTTGNSADHGPGLAFPVLDERLSTRLEERMAEVEKALTGHVRSRAGFVTEAASHLMEAGGKRFRPLLVLVAAETGDHPEVDDVITAACVVELTHLASLYHDDVMDEAELRRGSASANARWDNHVAILTGDFLFSKSSELTAELGAEAVRIQAQTFTRLVEGQILETLEPGPGEDPLEHYLDVVQGKTGSLIATSARYGAMFGGAAPDVQRALTSYGEIVGMTFQLSDDILDIASEAGVSGKTPGTDLREGVPTLPVLMARAMARPEDDRLMELLGSDLTDDARHAEALALLRRHPALDDARAYVVSRAAEAKSLLGVLDPGSVRDALEGFADLVATRAS